MKKRSPQDKKFWPLYWKMAEAAADQSVAERHQVGAVVVTPTGMISVGWNGMPAGLTNECENRWVEEPDETGQMRWRRKTDPRVIHAEMNALGKMIQQGVPTKDCLLFVTHSPCFQCAKALHGLGLKMVIYQKLHDCTEGITLLRETGTKVLDASDVF